MIWSLLLAIDACDDITEPSYEQFNSTADTIVVPVGGDELENQSISLNSSTEQVVVGTATLSPGGGPVGTRHELIVQVSEPWDTQVSRVTLITDSGDRGTETYELTQDSAAAGIHVIEVVSVGAADEVREDVFTVQLWAEESSSILSTETSAPEENETTE